MPVAASCGCFVVLYGAEKEKSLASQALFAGVVLLACVEKLAAVANTVSVERDWVCIMFYINIDRVVSDNGRLLLFQTV